MNELLFGSWGPQIVAFSRQYPWRVFAAVLCGILLLDLIFRRDRSSGSDGDADIGGWDGDSDGGSCGD